MLIDIIVFFLILVFAVLGAVQGFVVSVLYLAAWVFGIFSVWLFSGTFASMLNANLAGISPIITLCLGALLAFLLPFLVIRIAAAIAKYFIKKSGALTLANRILGAVFGALKGVAASVIVLTVVHYLPAQGNLKHSVEGSVSHSIYEKIPFANLWKEFHIQ